MWLEEPIQERDGGGRQPPRKVRGVGGSTKQSSRQTLVLGVDAREFPGGLLRLEPAFVYVEPPSS